MISHKLTEMYLCMSDFIFVLCFKVVLNHMASHHIRLRKKVSHIDKIIDSSHYGKFNSVSHIHSLFYCK